MVGRSKMLRQACGETFLFYLPVSRNCILQGGENAEEPSAMQVQGPAVQGSASGPSPSRNDEVSGWARLSTWYLDTFYFQFTCKILQTCMAQEKQH